MDVALLLLVTPEIPAAGAPGVPLLPAEAVGAAPVGAPRPDVGAPPGGDAPPGGAPREPGAAALTRTSAKSSLVIGSLNFLRRNRCSTRKSMLGGSAPTLLRCK